MAGKTGEMKITSPKATIIAALIAVVGIVVGSFLNPLAERLINNSTSSTSSRELPIEQIPFTVVPYSGDNKPSCCVGQASMTFKNSDDLQPVYALNFNIPENDSRFGYAGLAFGLNQSQNLSDFYALEFIIYFSDGMSQADVNMKDIRYNDIAFHFVGNENQWNTIVVPLANFIGVDLKAVQVIEFEAVSTYTTGTHWFEIRSIQFTKR